MARSSLANSSSKLNLSHRQIALFQKIILAGNQMAEALSRHDDTVTLPKNGTKLTQRWSNLMVQLVKMLH